MSELTTKMGSQQERGEIDSPGLTDSGGIQEETTVPGVPCLILRENTECPVTVTEGTNVLVGSDRKTIVREGLKALNGHRPGHRIPELWDGKAARRIVAVIVETFGPVGPR